MENHQVINLSVLAQLTGGDPARRVKYINMFLDILPGQLSMAEQAFQSNDFLKLKSTVHTLKAQLGYMGVVSAQKLAQEIEEMCVEKDLQPGIQTAFPEFYRICRKAETELQTEIYKS